MSEVEQTSNEQTKKLETFSKMLKADLDTFGEGNEKSSINTENNNSNPDFDLTAADILALIGDDNLASVLNIPEKTAIKLAIKNIPEKDRVNFKISSTNDKQFAAMKVRLVKVLMEKYGGNLNAKVSPEIAFLSITFISTVMVYVQTKGAANDYLAGLKLIEEKA